MAIRYTVAKGIEYYGNGYPVGKQVMRKDILKAVRKRLGITQKKLADDIGVTQQYLSSIERNDKPIPTMILRWIYDHI